MAEEGDNSQEKTEDPSQRKIEKAAEDGKVLTSKDMFVFTGLFTALIDDVCCSDRDHRTRTLDLLELNPIQP